jgi:mannose/fructose/N-acetylgalactosamine-specific phosphotransferase system component IID
MSDKQEAGNIAGVVLVLIVFTIILVALCYCACAGCYSHCKDKFRSKDSKDSKDSKSRLLSINIENTNASNI